MGVATKIYRHLIERFDNVPHLIEPRKLLVIESALHRELEIVAPEAAADVELDDTEPRAAENVGGVAVIPVIGTLVQRAMGMDALSGLTSYEALARDLERALADPAVEGILLEVDSYGGEAAGCFEFADKIHAARARKPVYAVANEAACSAGYAILSAAEKVFVPRTGIVGSVGVVMTHVDRSAKNAQEGLRVTHVYAGNRKVDGSPHQPLSDEARGTFQAEVDKLYGVFVDTVARNRGLEPQSVKATEAGCFVGEDAVKAGLADAVGGRDDAIAALKAAAEEKRMLEQLKQQVAALTGERDALAAKSAGLEAVVAEFKARDEQRQKDADAAWLEQLVQGQADAQAPLLADEQASIKEQLDAGNRAAAKSLAKAFTGLARTRAGQGSAKSTVLAPAAPATKTPAQGEAEILERKGWKVLLSEDKATILEATPPEKRS